MVQYFILGCGHWKSMLIKKLYKYIIILNEAKVIYKIYIVLVQQVLEILK